MTHSKHFFKLSSLSPTWQGSTEDFFVIFNQILCKVFLSQGRKDLYTPEFAFIFMISCIISCILMGFSELFTFGIFVESILFFWNWSLCFTPILLYSWYMLVNLINLGFYEKLKILGLVLNPIWGFCSIGLKLMKLACWFDVIDHYKLFSNLCDGQLVNFFKKLSSGFNFFWGFG